MKTIVIVAGLGRFYGAGKRLYLELKKNQSYMDLVLIDAEFLSRIVKKNNIEETFFSPDIRGYGFWQWKPLIIYHYIVAGYDSVIYLDAGCDIEPSIFLKFIDFFNECEYKLLLSGTGHNIENYTKPCVLYELNDSDIDTKNNQMLQAGFVCIKKDSKIKKIFYEAFDFIKSGRIDLFDDNLRGTIMPDYFIDHRHDQSILNLLLYKKKSITEVGVLPTDLTPPFHRDWCLFPPVIASRNSYSISLYWMLIKYKSKRDFPTSLVYALRAANKLVQISGYSSLMIDFFNKVFELRYKSRSEFSDFLENNISKRLFYVNELNSNNN